MTVPDRTPLGASTTNRMWYLDVDTSENSTPDWLPVQGMTEFQPSQDDNLEDDSDFDSDGFQSQSKTAEAFSLAFTVARKVQREDATQYDPGQEFLRSKGQGHMGNAAVVHVRWYEMSEDGPREEAYDGYGTVSWAPAGGAMTALNTTAVTVTGQGKRNSIDHPDTAAAAVPVVAALEPATGDAAGGDLVNITGSGFEGATAVKFGTDNATDYDILSDSEIEAVSPAHAAGTVNVTVVTGAGTSATGAGNSFIYTA